MNYKKSTILISAFAILLSACGNTAPSDTTAVEIASVDSEPYSEESTESIKDTDTGSMDEPEGLEATTEEATEEPKPSYHLADYDYSHDIYGRTNLVYYDGNYYFTGTMFNAFDNKLVKYSADSGETEIILDGVEFLYCINDVIYANKYPPSPDSHMQAFVLKSQEIIDDISGGTIGYAGGVQASDSDYLLYMTYDDDIATNFAISPLYGSSFSKSTRINYFGPVLDLYMEDGTIYFKGTDDEFADDPECWYKKYNIATEELLDITEADIPTGYVPFEDRGLSPEELRQYQTLTGSDGTLEAIYHDHLIYSGTKSIDNKSTTLIQIYDYEGNLLEEITGSGLAYIGCANDSLIYLDSDNNVQIYPME